MLLDPATGLLRGNGALSATWMEVEGAFVTRQAVRREELYAELKRYNQTLLSLLGCPFRQWLDGSFVSAKPRPADLDVVSFVPFAVTQPHLAELAAFKQPTSAYVGLDCYLVLQYPTGDPRYPLSRADEGYWNDLFRTTRPNRFGLTQTKAFVEIIVNSA